MNIIVVPEGTRMLPLKKLKEWMSGVYEGIEQMPNQIQKAIMQPASNQCASDLLLLCRDELGKSVNSIDDLIDGWNNLRSSRGLAGKWIVERNTVNGIFAECSCPLVHSGFIKLSPAQCNCSQGMLETIFSLVAEKSVDVSIRRSIGRGDDACEFHVTL